ncbi:MAG: PKD domain-containing protein, partial [Gaiellales bacterium]
MYRRLFAIAALVLLVGASPAAALNTAQPGIVSNIPAQGTPAVLDGVVNAVVQVGGQIVVGGQFTRVMEANGHVLARTDIFAFDVATGLVEPAFAPTVANGQVSTLSAGPDGQSVFAGGTFDTVNGQPEKRLVKLSLADGSIVPAFHAALEGSWVEDSDVRGNTLYIGGAIASVDGVARGRLAAVNATTGAIDPNLALDFTDKRAGKLRVAHFDISPDGTKLVATGTFTKVDGLDRNQIAMIDLSTTPASVSSWQTDAFTPACATRFDTYVRDVSFAPDGSYFVVVNTGAYFGGVNAGVICDSVQRWESGATGPGQQPTWVDYTGGDSLTQVAATGAAIYVGGHQRYLNNPFAGDTAGAGAVSRMGIAALDPQNGLPYTWNPGRYPRGSG